MKLNQHELKLLTDDDYRENVLKSECGKESAQDIIDEVNNEKRM